MSGLILSFDYGDVGYCRVYFKSQVGYLYCFQDEGFKENHFILYRCSSDGEPDYPLKLNSCESVECPPLDNELTIGLLQFLRHNSIPLTGKQVING